MTDQRQPFWVKCKADGHVWAVAFVPMEATTFARVLGTGRCPWCGAGPKGITIAKQDGGKLNEPLAPHQNPDAGLSTAEDVRGILNPQEDAGA